MIKKFIEYLYFRFVGAPRSEKFSLEEEKLIWERGERETQIEVLRFYLDRDRNRYFIAPDEKTRLLIRGQYLRTNYVLNLMLPAKKMKPISQESTNVVRISKDTTRKVAQFPNSRYV